MACTSGSKVSASCPAIVSLLIGSANSGRPVAGTPLSALAPEVEISVEGGTKACPGRSNPLSELIILGQFVAKVVRIRIQMRRKRRG